MQGGEFSVTYESEKRADGFLDTMILTRKRLRVRSAHGIHYGELIYEPCEMGFELVSLPADTPQEVADSVAHAYGRIIHEVWMPDDYPVVMLLRESCTICGRLFTDQVSKVIGLGPTRAERLGV